MHEVLRRMHLSVFWKALRSRKVSGSKKEVSQDSKTVSGVICTILDLISFSVGPHFFYHRLFRSENGPTEVSVILEE